MKTIVLSDHTADQQRARAAERDRDHTAALASYQAAVQTHKENRRRREQALVKAFKERKVWQTILRFFPYVMFLFNTGPRAPTLIRRGPDRDEIVWASGREGERRVAALLGQMSNDDWTLLSGYLNPQGEIDQILVGPGGVFALEIKYMNGLIYVDGDSWWRDKYDKWGNKVESGVPIADKKGRSPSVQVNRAADLLQRFFDRRAGAPHITRAVIFSHEKSQLGQIHNPTVQFIGILDKSSIRKLLAVGSQPLDAALARSVVAAIQSDHEFHKKSRRS